MTTRHSSDPLAVLTALRPRTDLDQLWSAAEQDTALARILRTPPRAEGPVHRPGRHRRRALTIALSGVLVVGGGSAAVAGGLVPQRFVSAFAYWQDPVGGTPTVDPATAERVATAPGPDGTSFTVVTAHARDGSDWRCTTALFESPASAALPGPADFTDVFGSSCRTGDQTGPFGEGAGLSPNGDSWVWQVSAGDAVRGELHTPSGESWPVVLVDGSFYGWFPAPDAGDPQAELVGFGADGAEVGRTKI